MWLRRQFWLHLHLGDSCSGFKTIPQAQACMTSRGTVKKSVHRGLFLIRATSCTIATEPVRTHRCPSLENSVEHHPPLQVMVVVMATQQQNTWYPGGWAGRWPHILSGNLQGVLWEMFWYRQNIQAKVILNTNAFPQYSATWYVCTVLRLAINSFR